MDELIETAELAAFTRTVDAGSLSRAAKNLGVPRATIGRRLARLEERLGARLIRRTTRNLVLTDEGRVLYEQAKLALSAVRDAVLSVRLSDGAVRGRLRVSVPPIPGPSFQDFVTDFLARHPDVKLELSVATTTVSFGEDGFDVALRASTMLHPGLVRRHLAQAPMSALASPAYLKRRGTPKRAKDLGEHACILGHLHGGDSPAREWPLRNGKGTVRVDGPLATNDIRLALQAARAGLGIALLPASMAAASVRSGELVAILEAEVGAESSVAIVYPERQFMRPVVRVFVEELVAWGKRELPTMDERCEEAKVRAARRA